MALFKCYGRVNPAMPRHSVNIEGICVYIYSYIYILHAYIHMYNEYIYLIYSATNLMNSLLPWFYWVKQSNFPWISDYIYSTKLFWNVWFLNNEKNVAKILHIYIYVA